MGGCTFVDTRFPIFIFLTVFSFFFEVSAAVQVLRLSPSHSSSTGKARGRTHLFILLDRSPAYSCFPFPFSPSLAGSEAEFTDDISLSVFPAFWCRLFFARNMLSFIFPTCLLTLLCFFSDFRSCVYFLSARNGLLGLS